MATRASTLIEGRRIIPALHSTSLKLKFKASRRVRRVERQQRERLQLTLADLIDRLPRLPMTSSEQLELNIKV